MFLPDRRERDGRGVVKHKDLFVKIFQVKAVVSLSAAALVAVPNSQYGNPYMSIFFCDCNGSSGGAVVDATAAVLLAMQGETKNKDLAALSVIAVRTIFCFGSLALFRVPSCSR